ncbi:hypothetical protein NM688_g7996 [Phlebia brevispora]|uniref:Uncharacterized protein n=1 Tax=Phlebia brevispora TaxID=194682 RepID=A0ACC1RYU3_9APHY|nr:hypothetical protein NM688_g7996 [Phlebia brevispora]
MCSSPARSVLAARREGLSGAPYQYAMPQAHAFAIAPVRASAVHQARNGRVPGRFPAGKTGIGLQKP